MFGIDKKDLKGGIVFITIIICFSYLINWNVNRINQKDMDNKNNIVYNNGGGTYE